MYPSLLFSLCWLAAVGTATFAIPVNAQEQVRLETEPNGTDNSVAAGQKTADDDFRIDRYLQELEPRNRFSLKEPRLELPGFASRLPGQAVTKSRLVTIKFPTVVPDFLKVGETDPAEIYASPSLFPTESVVPGNVRWSFELKRPFPNSFHPEKDFPTEEHQAFLSLGEDDPPKVPPKDRFHWRPAINQSLMMLGIQHGYALVAQEKTRSALANGNFFTDYWRSVRGLRGWDDGNRFFTNYIAHPMQGGLTGFIFVQNHDRAKKQKFAESKQYWKDRFKTLIWSTAWSTQFELGPISQSSIGNVGHYGGLAYVDLVVTPTVGTAWMMSEEAIDRYIIRHFETHSLTFRAILRMFLNPMRSVANMLRFREPWYRDRPLGH